MTKAPASPSAEAAGGVECEVCGGETGVGRFCARCGVEVRATEGAEPPWPTVGDSTGPVELRAPLPAPPGARRFLGGYPEGRRYAVLVTPRDDPGGGLAGRVDARAALGELALPPSSGTDADGLRYTLTLLPDAPSLQEGLTAMLADRDGAPALAAVERWIRPLAAAFAQLHADGVGIGNPDPAEVLVDSDGQVRFRSPPLVFSLGEKQPTSARRAIRGFSAPEVRGHCGGRVDARSDVYFLGIALYYTLARVAPLQEAGESSDRLPNPLVFHEDCPAELAAVAWRAVSVIPSRRYDSCVAFRGALERALDVARARTRVTPLPLRVDIGHELHIGVLKGQYSPTNQDDLFLAYNGQTGIGLFLISDGVSISEHGSGDLASGCVRHEAHDAWRAIVEGRVDGDEVDDQTLARLGHLDPVLPESIQGRQRILQRMLDAANGRIGRLVHQTIPRFHGPPEGIMAATAVAVLLEHNHATLCSIGDSRIYLVRDGHVASLMVEHDLGTQLIRMGRAPTFARSVQSSAALIRCVGEFDKDSNDKLVPVPLHPEFRELDLLPGDTLVLSSDGIPDYGGLDEEDAERRIAKLVSEAPSATWAAFELMVGANRGGGGDNISCIVLRFGEEGGR